CIKFAVRNTAAGRHQLKFSGGQRGDITFTVAVGDRTFQDVADDFHIAVAVGWKACAGDDFIIVDYAQRRVTHVRRIVIAAKGKGMAAVQPVELCRAAFFTASDADHDVTSAGAGSDLSLPSIKLIYFKFFARTASRLKRP